MPTAEPEPISAIPVSAVPVSAEPMAAVAPVSPAVPTPPHLGIDFGTANTVAVLRVGDRRRPLLFDGYPGLPSTVGVAPDGTLLVGQEALRLAPDAQAAPKPRIADGSLRIGDREVEVPDAIAAILARVLDEARLTLGGTAPAVTLTHPAAWGPGERDVLLAAATSAGILGPALLPEPVAVARYLTGRVPEGAVVVYDLGTGSFDATVLVARDGILDVAATTAVSSTDPAALIAATESALRDADPAGVTVGAVVLLGGASHLPSIADAVRQSLGLDPTPLESPDTVIAEGAAG